MLGPKTQVSKHAFQISESRWQRHVQDESPKALRTMCGSFRTGTVHLIPARKRKGTAMSNIIPFVPRIVKAEQEMPQVEKIDWSKFPPTFKFDQVEPGGFAEMSTVSRLEMEIDARRARQTAG